MREFEKWWNKEIRPYIHNPKDKDVVKAGWKEALAWVLGTFEKNIDTQIDEDRVDVYKMVANELEE